ncbi:MAG TPA: sigma-54 dependent transcriptional regulator, partial [Bacteroidota bacterium]
MKDILVVDDDQATLLSLKAGLVKRGYTIDEAGSLTRALELLQGNPYHVVLADIRLDDGDGFGVLEAAKRSISSPEVIMMTAFGSIETAIKAIRGGAYDYIVKPFQFDATLIVIQRALEKRRLVHRVRALEEQLRDQIQASEIIGQAPTMVDVLQLMAHVSKTESTILITGESGTGKELVAKSIHYNSSRSDRPMITVNSATIPEHLQESELFGYARGAFTGAAQDKAGLFEDADGGTLFLDEMGELSPVSQTKLLRFLQDGEIRRVGGNTIRKVNVRVIASTNRDLRAAIREKSFREDLYYRLNVVEIPLPALRERKEDIPILTNHFLSRYSIKLDKPNVTISDRALQLLQSYNWPGNVRELQNVIERALIVDQDGLIGVDDLPLEFRGAEDQVLVTAPTKRMSLDEVEKEYILTVLKRCGGNRQQ